MKRLLLLALFTVGCAAAGARRPAIKRGPTSLSFQVDPSDSELWDAASRAAAAWSYALGIPVTLAPDGAIPIFWVPDLDTADPECAPPADRPIGAWGGACSPGIGTPDARILLNGAAPARDRLYRWLLHEMGHHLGARGGHLDDPGNPPASPNAIMNRYATGPDGAITLADVRYVCESPTGVTCPGPVGRLSL